METASEKDPHSDGMLYRQRKMVTSMAGGLISQYIQMHALKRINI